MATISWLSDTFRQSYVDQFWLSHLQFAYTLPLLGRTDEANAHVTVLLKMRLGFTFRETDAYYKRWCFAASFREKMQQALRAAGLPECGLAVRADEVGLGP